MKEYTEVLQAIADKLSVPAEHLWSVMIQQAAVSATTWLIIITATFVMLFISLNATVNYVRKGSIDDDVLFFYQIASFIILIFTILIFFAGLEEIINGYFNPDYWALMHLKKIL